MRSFVRLRAVDVGFDERNLAVLPFRLPQASYPSPASTGAFFDAVLDRLGHVDGNTAAAFVSSAPFAGADSGTVFLRIGESLAPNTQPPDADTRVVSAGYFRTMGIPLLRGRDFLAEDRPGAPEVLIINSAMAKKYWPNTDAIGQRVRIGDVVKGPVATIVGIVGDARYQSIETDDVHAMMYFASNPRARNSHRARCAARASVVVGCGRSASADLRRHRHRVGRRVPAQSHARLAPLRRELD